MRCSIRNPGEPSILKTFAFFFVYNYYGHLKKKVKILVIQNYEGANKVYYGKHAHGEWKAPVAWNIFNRVQAFGSRINHLCLCNNAHA